MGRHVNACLPIDKAGMEKRCLVGLISRKSCSSTLHPATNPFDQWVPTFSKEYG